MKKFILNGVELDTVIYPNGEIDIKNSEEELHSIVKDNLIEVFWYNCTFQDYLSLSKLVSVLGFFDKLYIDCLPYQRSDRDFFNNCVPNSINGVSCILEVSCRLIKSLLDFPSTVIINDPHNEKKVLEYLPNVEFVYKGVSNILNTEIPNLMVYPDINAYRKYSKLLPPSILELDHIVLEKERDIKTGKIISHHIYKQFDSGYGFYRTACIIDDICDYGGTFISAKKVIEDKIGHVPTWWLSVSHNTNCDKTELLKHFKILE